MTGDEASQAADIDVESLQVKDAAGLAPNIEALHQVFGQERDIVIARSVLSFFWKSPELCFVLCV